MSAGAGSTFVPVPVGQGPKGFGALGRGLRDFATIFTYVVPMSSLRYSLSRFVLFEGGLRRMGVVYGNKGGGAQYCIGTQARVPRARQRIRAALRCARPV